MTEYISIPSGLLRAVAKELEFASGPDPDDFTEVPTAMVQAMAQYLRDGDSDDHSVGLCTCDSNALAYELELALDGSMTCPACGGDGFNFDAEQAKIDIAEGAKKYGLSLSEAESLLVFSAGMSDCAACGGRGVASIRDHL